MPTIEKFGPGQTGLLRLEDERMAVQFSNNNGAIDAFGRIRVSEPYSQSDISNEYNASPLFWESVLAGNATATHLPNEAAVRMRCTTTNGDKVTRQTKQYIRYQPGKSQLILFSVVIGAAKANVRQRVGYFDDYNGLFFEQTSAGLYIVKRSSVTGAVVDTRIAQTNWNLDKLDGTGCSGITLDTSKVQIIAIDFGGIGTGRVRFGFSIDGLVRYVHEILNSNINTTVYMHTASLPLRYELENTAESASTTDMLQIAAALISEGGVNEKNLTFAASNGATLRTAGTAEIPILSIRCGTAFPVGGTIINRETIAPLKHNIFSEDSSIFYRVIYNGTIEGASWGTVDATHSGVEYDVSGTAISGGVVIDAGYIATSNQAMSSALLENASDLVLTLNAAGTVGDTLTIACKRVGNTDSDVGVVLVWKELY